MGESEGPRQEMACVDDHAGYSLKRLRQVDIFPWIPARYALAILSSLGFFNVYALRVNLSVAIVQMDNGTAQHYRHAARVSFGRYREGMPHSLINTKAMYIATCMCSYY